MYFRVLFIASFLIPKLLIGNQAQDSLIQKGEYYYAYSEKVFEKSLDSCLYYTFLAKKHFKEAKQWDRYVGMLSGIAGVYYYKSDYENALSYNLKAINACLKYLNKKSPVYGTALNMRGLLLDKKGDYKAAINYLEGSLEISKLNNVNPGFIATAYHNLAKMYQKSGDYAQTVLYFRKALDIRKKNLPDDHLHVIRNYINLGSALLEIQDYLAAEKSLMNAKTRLSLKEHSPVIVQRKIEFLQTLTELYLKQDNIQKAKTTLDAISRLDVSPAEQKTLSLFARFYRKSGDYNKELIYLNQLKEIVFEKFGPSLNHPEQAKALLEIAHHYLRNRNYNTTVEFADKALDILDVRGFYRDSTIGLKWSSDLDVLKVLDVKGTALLESYEKEKDIVVLKEALKCYLEIKQVLIKLKGGFIEQESKKYLNASLISIHENAIEVSRQLFNHSSDPIYLEYAFWFSENSKAAMLLDDLRNGFAMNFGAIPDSLLDRERALKADIAFYEKSILEAKIRGGKGEEDKLNIWEKYLFEKKESYKELIRYFEAYSPKYYKQKYQSQSLSLKNLDAKDEIYKHVVLEFFIGVNKLYVFTVLNGAVNLQSYKITSSFYQQLTELRQLIVKPSAENSFEQDYHSFIRLSNYFYHQFLEPSLVIVPTHRKSLLIVPDGILHYLPFDIFLTKKVDSFGPPNYSPDYLPYLLNDYALSYTYSLSFFSRTYKGRSKKKSVPFLGVAPEFKGKIKTQNKLSALFCNIEEVESIQSMINGDLLKRDEASIDNFKAKVKQSSIIHLATHGLIQGGEDQLHKIFFSDGFLTHLDLNSLQLESDLFVLGACETGTGELLKGEGVMSLARSLANTGNAASLVSLWSVDDCVTKDIMVSVYKNLNNGIAKHQALRQAKLKFLRNADLERRHPAYWAPFVLHGSTNPLKFYKSWSAYKKILLLTPLIAGLIYVFIWKRQYKAS